MEEPQLSHMQYPAAGSGLSEPKPADVFAAEIAVFNAHHTDPQAGGSYTGAMDSIINAIQADLEARHEPLDRDDIGRFVANHGPFTLGVAPATLAAEYQGRIQTPGMPSEPGVHTHSQEVANPLA